MTTTVAPLPDAVFTKLGAFVQTIVPPGTEVIRGLANRVSYPAGPFVMMTGLYQFRIATNQHLYSDPFPDPGAVSVEQKIHLDVQIDCYGPDSEAWATMLSTLLRDAIGCDALAPAAQPLYADDARMIPLVTGEEQYLERWTLTAALEYDPVTTVTQDFAGSLDIDLINVDEAYPP